MAIQTFPTLKGIGFPVGKDILTKSLINQSVSGKRAVVPEWTYPIYRITLPLNYMMSNTDPALNQDWQTFTGFFKLVGGPAIPFHWYDQDDNSVTDQAIGTGDGTTTVFPFVRTLGGFTEPVQDVTTVSDVKLNGTSTGSYTLVSDSNWGFKYAISFTTPPGTGVAITSSFTYNWPCEFENDGVQMLRTAQRFWNAKQIQFITKKVV